MEMSAIELAHLVKELQSIVDSYSSDNSADISLREYLRQHLATIKVDLNYKQFEEVVKHFAHIEGVVIGQK